MAPPWWVHEVEAMMADGSVQESSKSSSDSLQMVTMKAKSSAGKVRGVAELLCAVGVGTVWVGE